MRVIFAMLFTLAFASLSAAQTTTPLSGQLDFGAEGLIYPPLVIGNGHSPRTAQLLGEAYRRKEPLVWKRVQLVAEMGETAQPAAGPFLIEAMKDPSAEVRAEAARAAAMVGDAALLGEVEKLVKDSDPLVRREAVLSAAAIARAKGPVATTTSSSTTAIERGLADDQPQVTAAAIQAAWTPQHAQQIAGKLPTLPADLKPEAALALGRLKAAEHAPVVIPLLGGDVPARLAAVQALGEMGNKSLGDSVVKMLADPHPTIRREATTAMAKLVDAPTRQAKAIQMLGDADSTVREAAAKVLTPTPSTQALDALVDQLNEPYVPLHEAVRQALVHPGDDDVRRATIDRAARILDDANPRRREDASYVLGGLHSNAAIEKHVALLQWDPKNPAKSDWPLIAQAAESMGFTGEASLAVPPLMKLIKAAPDALASVQRPQRDDMANAMAGAVLSAARLHHPPALAEAMRILETDPLGSPRRLRAASAFAVGVLARPRNAPEAAKLQSIFESVNEDRSTKFEALKALGNLRDRSSVERLKTIAETEPAPDMRWIAHWAYERCAEKQIPYTPPTENREPPVSISDLAR